MIKIGSWMFDFKVMRGYHADGVFVNLKVCKRDGLTTEGKIHGKQIKQYWYSGYEEELLSNKQRIIEAYASYVAQKELLE